MNSVYEPGRDLPVRGQYDVLVAGGGIAGVSAALAAARNGAKVLLLEKMCMLGGLATAGLVAFYLPICDGRGRQICFGITEELLKLSVEHCGKLCQSDYYNPEPWFRKATVEERKERRFAVQFNPQTFALDLEKLLRKEGVRILYDTTVCDVILDGSRVEAVVVENKSGRSAYLVNSVVDATGDADICQRAGVPTQLYEKQNILAAWSTGFCQGKIKVNIMGAADSQTAGEELLPSKRRFSGVDGEENSEMVQLAHQIVLDKTLQRRKEDETYELVTLPTMPQLRMTRRLVGEYTLDESEKHKTFPDSIGLISNWKRRGDVYEIPFRTLYNSRVPNLLCAGRCISVTDPMWDISRVIPPCAVTGQAVGTAAALSSDIPTLPVEKLQAVLREAGVALHESEVAAKQP